MSSGVPRFNDFQHPIKNAVARTAYDGPNHWYESGVGIGEPVEVCRSCKNTDLSGDVRNGDEYDEAAKAFWQRWDIKPNIRKCHMCGARWHWGKEATE